MFCEYTKIKEDGYHAYWKTECGHDIRIASPMEVGFPRAPLPNEDGEFCPYCGKKIRLNYEKNLYALL